MATIRLAIAADLHYSPAQAPQPSRPAAAFTGAAGDPMHALLQRLGRENASGGSELKADYLLCAGDITNKASPEGFDEGWARLKDLQVALDARHLLAVTGNHEVNSRAGEVDDQPGNSEQALDPLAIIQKHPDYPCTAFDDTQRWVYWGRGYQVINEPQAVFLLLNSSHFHPTTRANEFERGRVSDIALAMLRTDLKVLVEANKSKVFIALMHHHPIPHQPLDMPQDRINMHNGPQLMELLQETGVTWLVIHGHKHQGRLILAQGGLGSPVVFAAGSFGAILDGDAATLTKLQFYILEIDLVDQSVQPKARAHVRALYWSGSSWEWTKAYRDGVPDRCGYSVPSQDLEALVDELYSELNGEDSVPFLSWDEVLERKPKLRYLMPADARILRKIMESKGVKSTWPDNLSFPSEVAK
jgi:predicted MPP superfamily phosphohydrolase